MPLTDRKRRLAAGFRAASLLAMAPAHCPVLVEIRVPVNGQQGRFVAGGMVITAPGTTIR
jgi:hypothetical protein